MKACRLLASHAHCKQRSIQTHIFNHQSASYVLPRLPVLAGYYFVRPEPLKITKSASSSTPSQEQDYQCLVIKNADKADGLLTRHSSLSVFQATHTASLESLSITASACLVNPLFPTGYTALRPADAQSNRSAPTVNRRSQIPIFHTFHITDIQN
jgi:hypothetical protein